MISTCKQKNLPLWVALNDIDKFFLSHKFHSEFFSAYD